MLAELRLPEGFCPHPDHGRLTPQGRWGYCPSCDVAWRCDDVLDALWIRATVADLFIDQALSLGHLDVRDERRVIERAVVLTKRHLTPA